MIEVNKIFNDVVEMDLFIMKYLKDYAPAGYDTQVTINLRQSYDDWTKDKRVYEVIITRLESCD